MKRIERTIINALRKGPLSTTAIAKRYGLTEPAVRRHCCHLRERNLVYNNTDKRPYLWTINLHDPFFRGKGETILIKEANWDYLTTDYAHTLFGRLKCACGGQVYLIRGKPGQCDTCKRNYKMVVNVEVWDE